MKMKIHETQTLGDNECEQPMREKKRKVKFLCVKNRSDEKEELEKSN